MKKQIENAADMMANLLIRLETGEIVADQVEEHLRLVLAAINDLSEGGR